MREDSVAARTSRREYEAIRPRSCDKGLLELLVMIKLELASGLHVPNGLVVVRVRTRRAITNKTPKPFIWSKTADDILASIAQFCKRTSNSGH